MRLGTGIEKGDRVSDLQWDEIDRRAVDTARILAADAVEKVGNGHPGTAMSLAPAAYLLYQRVMRHDPADPQWPGRDRFILSAGHSSLTQYVQLYLGGFGLELDDLKALRTWGGRSSTRISVRRSCANSAQMLPSPHVTLVTCGGW